MAGKFNYETAAQVLADAAIFGDAKAVARAGITSQTLRNYRKRMSEDETLLHYFAQKKALLEREWSQELAPAIRNGIDFLSRAAQVAEPSDPDAIHAVAGAVKILTGVSLTQRILDARLAERSGQDMAADRTDAAKPSESPAFN